MPEETFKLQKSEISDSFNSNELKTLDKVKNLEEIAVRQEIGYEEMGYKITKDIFLIYPDESFHNYCKKDALIKNSLIEFIKLSINNGVLYIKK